MLSIGKLGAGLHRYYLDKVAERSEGEGEAAGYWLGDAAEELGLEGHVEPDQLVAMLTGVDPATGEPLGLQHVARRGPVPGFDLTFSAPKSVSLTWALGGEDAGAEIAAAHADAVEAALGYLQREACWTRRGKGGREFVPGNGFIAAAYQGPGWSLDPSLPPSHLQPRQDGRLHLRGHPAPRADPRLGFEWAESRKDIAEIAGFDPDHLGEIEAGGLFASIASRTAPVLLDEVIRHSHELDREGARRIRLGEGGEAIAVYRDEGRLAVAEDPAELREAMAGSAARSCSGAASVAAPSPGALRSGSAGQDPTPV